MTLPDLSGVSSSIVLVLACVLYGCALLPVDAAQVSATATPDASRSGHVAGEVAVDVVLRNGSRRTLRFGVDDVSDPPFSPDGIDYKVFKSGPGGLVEDPSRRAFADGVLPLATLSVGAGDAATLLVFLENIGSTNCSQDFVVELKDKSGDVFRSKPFRPCVPQPGR